MAINEAKQLALDLKLEAKYNLVDFYAGENLYLIDMLEEQLRNKNEFSFFYIWGAKDSGKTHILKGIENYKEESCLYENGENIKNLEYLKIFIENSKKFDILCLDDIEKITLDRKIWEEAIFNIFNTYKSNAKKFIVSSSLSIEDLQIKLKDLKSRLSWGMVHKLIGLKDEQKIQVLIMYAKNRLGLNIKIEVMEYIMLRASRNMEDLINILNYLGKTGMEEHKEISKIFVKNSMQW